MRKCLLGPSTFELYFWVPKLFKWFTIGPYPSFMFVFYKNLLLFLFLSHGYPSSSCERMGNGEQSIEADFGSAAVGVGGKLPSSRYKDVGRKLPQPGGKLL